MSLVADTPTPDPSVVAAYAVTDAVAHAGLLGTPLTPAQIAYIAQQIGIEPTTTTVHWVSALLDSSLRASEAIHRAVTQPDAGGEW